MHRTAVRSAVVAWGILVVMLCGCSAINPFSRDRAGPVRPHDDAPADWQADKTPNHLALARKLVRQGHYSVALRQLADARKASPDEPEVHYLTGVCRRETGELKAARSHFLRAIALDAGYAPAFDGLGVTCFLMNDPDRAREALQKAIALNPANADYANNLGALEMRRHRLDAARVRFEACLHLDAGHARCANNLAECLVRLGLADEARALLQAHFPTAVACNNLGAAYLATGRTGKAREMFRRALDLDPGLDPARHNLNRMHNEEVPQP